MTPNRAWRPIAALTIVAALGAAGCSGTKGTPTSAGPTTATAAAPSGPAEALQTAFVQVLQRVRPSVVEISTSSALGSGIVYAAGGYIVTNAHVVAGSTAFQVTLSDGRTLDANLVGAYVPNDLAVIKVAGTNLPTPATFANSSGVQTGDIVLAIGNPLGLASSVTDGIVSDTGRIVGEGNGVTLPGTIQTSAAINPGNSGGALVDLDGAVVGIPTLAATDPQLGGGAAPGIGFAIPSNTVKLIADQLVHAGAVTVSDRAALGIRGASATDASGSPIGVLLRTVQPHEAAANAGIAAGTVVTAVAGQATPDLATLEDVLAGLAPRTRTTVDVLLPTGARHAVSVVLTDLAS